MRLCVAVVPPRPVLLELRAALSTLPHGDARVRWTHPESWHITLAFLGEVPETTLPDLTERLARAAGRATPMELAIVGGGHFDSHTLWAGVQGDRDRLGRLSESVTAAARRCRVKVDEKPFRPHVTLARVRGEAHEGPADLRPYVERMQAFRTPRWLVKEIGLFESLPPAGVGRPPVYVGRGHWALTGR